MTPQNVPNHPQFSLFALFAITAVFAVVFGLIAALKTPPLQVLLGFALFTGVAAAVAALVEITARLFGLRRGGSRIGKKD